MAIIHFPPINLADEDGLLALGGDLEVNSLLLAYKQGIFPWPISEDLPLAWFSPDPRGVFFVDNFHQSRSFKRFLNNHEYEVSFNTQFENVINECARAKNRTGQAGTWITEELIGAYIELFSKGHAFSVEVTEDEKLVGGLYGVCIKGFLSGESMFYHRDNASKLALYSLCEQMKSKGLTWFDTQMVTTATAKLGAIEIKRDDYIILLEEGLKKEFTRDQIFNQ